MYQDSSALSVQTIITCLLLSAFSNTYAATATKKVKNGKALATKLYNRPDGKTAISKVSMTVQKKKSKPRLREFVLLIKEPQPSTVKSLIRFIKPAEVKNTVLLTIDKPGPASEQSIYLPALRRSRKISSSRKGGFFVGSDFTYEDLRDREVDEDHHRIVGNETINNMPTTILESIPIDQNTSLYSKKKSWIHLPSLIPVKVIFYGKDKKALKRLDVHEVKKISGFWTVIHSTLKNLKSKSSTQTKVNKIRYNKKIPDSYFTKKYLENPELIDEL